MLTEKQLIKFGLYSERAHRLAFDIAMQAGSLGENGIAIIADETRNVGIKLHRMFDGDEQNKDAILDAVSQLKYLALNGWLEILRVANYQLYYKPTMPLAVILDEINNLTNDIETAFNTTKELPLIRQKVAPQNLVITSDIHCISFFVGDLLFTENVRFVKEVLYYGNGDSVQLEDGCVKLRGINIPVIRPDKLTSKNENKKTLLIINIDYSEKAKQIAVPTETFPAVFRSSIGVSTECKEVICKDFVRECWTCEEDSQMLFLDYDKLL